jgi:hypothetical protein
MINFFFDAGKVGNIGSYPMLPAEFQSFHFTIAQVTPQYSFGIRHTLSKRSCIVDCQSPLILTFSPLQGAKESFYSCRTL